MMPRKSVSGRPAVPTTHDFTFDRVFPPESTQADVYEEISHLVQSAVDGYNVCLFAYGQTGSGKTHTMLGREVVNQTTVSTSKRHSAAGMSRINAGYELVGKNRGMMPRAAEHVFAYCDELRSQGWEFDVEATVLEIYCEQVYDLLPPPEETHADDVASGGRKQHRRGASGGAMGMGAPSEVHHRHIGDNKFVTEVPGVRARPVRSPQDVLQILHDAMQVRATAETKCNARSSRSHTVFTLTITGRDVLQFGDAAEPRVGRLHLVDLAGSERLKQSGSANNSKLLKETQAINKSLSCLGNVIGALAKKTGHVPYRDSKLTYLLQHSLCGNSKALMFCNLSPVESALQESLVSLRFAEKVNSVRKK